MPQTYSLSVTQAESWLENYGLAWQNQDSKKIAEIFTAGARYKDHAFKPAMTGSDEIKKYWTAAAAAQRDVSFASTVWSIVENVVIAHWTAEFKPMDKDQVVKLDGVFHLTFQSDPQGAILCDQLLEWWYASA